MDTLVLAIVQHDDADAAIGALTRAGFGVTVIASVGGFLRAGNVTLLIGLNARQVEHVRAVLQQTCHRRAIHTPVETSIGSATMFVLSVARYVHIGADRAIVDVARAPSTPGTLQMILAIVAQEQVESTVAMLTDWSYRATIINTTGGFWRRGNTTLLVGVRAERVDSIVKQICRLGETNSSEPRATIFVLNLVRLEHV